MLAPLETPCAPHQLSESRHLAGLNRDAALAVFSFLDMRSLCAMLAVCRWSRSTLLSRPAIARDAFRAEHPYCDAAEGDAISVLTQHIALELQYRLSEVSMLTALPWRVTCDEDALERFVVNIGLFPSRPIARAVSLRRQRAMRQYLLQRTDEVVTKTSRYGELSFLPCEFGEIAAVCLRPRIIDARGFVGYAIDLLMLSESQERWRNVLERIIYGDMSVWETEQDAVAYGATCYASLDAPMMVDEIAVVASKPDSFRSHRECIALAYRAAWACEASLEAYAIKW